MTEEVITIDGELGKKVRGGYIRELKEELKKVSWSPKEELLQCTKVVIGSTILFGLSIYLVDLFIQSALTGFHMLIQKIFG